MATFIQNSFGLKVSAGHYVDYSSAEDLRKALRDSTPKPWLPIGRGSNLLFSGEVFQGTVLHCTDDTVETSFGSNYVRVRVGAGLRWDAFVEMCVEKGWYGAENLSLIPGDVGAAAVQNIGLMVLKPHLSSALSKSMILLRIAKGYFLQTNVSMPIVPAYLSIATRGILC